MPKVALHNTHYLKAQQTGTVRRSKPVPNYYSKTYDDRRLTYLDCLLGFSLGKFEWYRGHCMLWQDIDFFGYNDHISLSYDFSAKKQ